MSPDRKTDIIHYFHCLKGTLDVVIGLEGGQDDIQEPAKQQNASTDVLESSVAAKLGSNVAVAEGRDKPSDEDEADSNAGADDIDRYREGEGPCGHVEDVSLKKRVKNIFDCYSCHLHLQHGRWPR